MMDNMPLSSENFTNFSQNGVQVDTGCAFMYNDGSWGSSFSTSLCKSLELCFICAISGTPIFTMKGLCEKGTPLDWNYYMYVNSSNELEYFDGYKKNTKLAYNGMNWTAETGGSRVQLISKSSPIGRLDWDWHEDACNSITSEKRELAFSKCNFGEELTCHSGNCISLEERCNGGKDCDDGSDEDNCNLVIISKSYRNVNPPKLDKNKETRIITKLHVLSIDKINSVTMHVGITIELTMKWYDGRLQFRNLVPGQKHILNDETIQSLWLPFKNLLFENSIIGKTQSAKYYEVSLLAAQNITTSFESMNPYRSLEDVWFEGKDNLLQATKRLRIEYFCNFYLIHFPFDHQKCDLVLKMKNTKNSYVYFSKEESTAIYSGEKEVNEFQILNISSHIKQRNQFINITNLDSKFVFSMELKRDYKDHVILIFFPELILWFIAYITIFLKIHDISNRSRISVTILLVLVALIGSVKHKIPHTPYFKYIDIWSIWYLSNIFLITCFHVFMERSISSVSTDLSIVYPWKSNLSSTSEDNENENTRDKFRVKVNNFAAFLFPVVTTVFNAVYFSLSIYKNYDFHD